MSRRTEPVIVKDRFAFVGRDEVEEVARPRATARAIHDRADNLGMGRVRAVRVIEDHDVIDAAHLCFINDRCTYLSTTRISEDCRNVCTEHQTILESVPLSELRQRIFGVLTGWYSAWIADREAFTFWKSVECFERERG
jgi:hypothetical protein